MELSEILSRLHQEKKELDRAIQAMEALIDQGPRKRGRPRKYVFRSAAAVQVRKQLSQTNFERRGRGENLSGGTPQS